MIAVAKPTTSQVVRTANTDEQKDRIFRFRYQIEVTELKKTPEGVDHQRQMVRDDLDETGVHYYVESDGNIIASARRNSLGNSSISETLAEAFQLESFVHWSGAQLGMVSRLLIAPAARGSLLYHSILRQAFEDARGYGTLFGFEYCRSHLVRFYQQMGWRQLGSPFLLNDELYIPMVLAMTDIEYLESVQSLFSDLSKRYRHDESAEWFNQQFAHLPRFENQSGKRNCRNCRNCLKKNRCASTNNLTNISQS